MIKEKKILHRMKIKFKKIDDLVFIVGFENTATEEDIRKIKGNLISKLYFNSYPNFHYTDDNLIVINYTDDDGIANTYILQKDSIYDFRTFEKIIEIMKEAGERLIYLTNVAKNLPNKSISI